MKIKHDFKVSRGYSLEDERLVAHVLRGPVFRFSKPKQKLVSMAACQYSQWIGSRERDSLKPTGYPD